MQHNVPQYQNTHISREHIRIALFFVLAGIAILAGALLADTGVSNTQQSAAATAPVSTSTPPSAFDSLSLSAESAIVWDIQNKRALYTQRAETQLPLASITKLMLGLVAYEHLSPTHPVAIAPEAIAQEGDSDLTIGETWQLRELLDLTLVSSSNDGAYAIAHAVGTQLDRTTDDPIARTVSQMNETARELGLSQTYFVNVTGLDMDEALSGAYGSARDVAQLLSYIHTHHPDMLAATRHARITTTSAGGTHIATNTNDTLPDIAGLIGSKTGYTDLAGGNLAVLFDAGVGRPIAAVVLGSTYTARFSDIVDLVETTRESRISE